MHRQGRSGIKQKEHVPFYHWCVSRGYTLEHIKNDRGAFWIFWFKRWIRIPPYGWLDDHVQPLFNKYVKENT